VSLVAVLMVAGRGSLEVSRLDLALWSENRDDGRDGDRS
jgi:hypothetical protein